MLSFAIIEILQHEDVLTRFETFLVAFKFSLPFLCNVLKPCRIQAEVDEVFGDKQDVDADDLDKMIYTKQVTL